MEVLLDHIAIENALFIMGESFVREEELEEMYYRLNDIDRELREEMTFAA